MFVLSMEIINKQSKIGIAEEFYLSQTENNSPRDLNCEGVALELSSARLQNGGGLYQQR